MSGGLSYRILDSSPDGALDLDVTGVVRGTPQLTWTALGGCETARLQLDLPLSELPNLSEQSRLIVTDQQARGIWDGYCTDPGGVDDDSGESFDLVATGSMVVASDRVEPLVYADVETNRWGRSADSVESARTDSEEVGGVAGWLLAHPEGYPIGPGTAVGIEYRALEHSAQGIGGVRFTLTAGAGETGYEVQIRTFRDGVLVDTVTRGMVASAQTVTLRAGVDISIGVDVVAVSLVRTGPPTNVTTDRAWVRLTEITVYGARVDRHGQPVTALSPLTSRAVVEDLIGRGMLGPVDPAAAIVEDSTALHAQLAWPEGVRGAGVLAALREDDPDMVWMFGVRHPGGYEFTWARWPETEVRYDVTEPDALTQPGSEEQRCHRVSVFYTDPVSAGSQGVRPLRRVVVELAEPGGTRIRDANPINLGDSTPNAARAAGEAELTRLAMASSAATATIARRVDDRVTGLKVEPWELRPGGLARIEATGEVLRVTEVTCDVGPEGATARLTLGDPAQTLEDKLISFLRGETDPSAPLIEIPPPPVVPPTTARATLADLYAAADAAAAAAAEAAEKATIALGAANGKNKTWFSTAAPGSTPNTAGDIWFQKDPATQSIVAQWEGLGAGLWAVRQIRNEVIANLDAGKLVAGSAFTNALSVKTNFTLGDADTDGVIQSYNFANSSTGIFINKNGIVAKGGSLAGATLTGATVIGGSFATGPTNENRCVLTDYDGTLGGVLEVGGGLAFYNYLNQPVGGISFSPSTNSVRVRGGGSLYFDMGNGEVVVNNGGMRIPGGGFSAFGDIGTFGQVRGDVLHMDSWNRLATGAAPNLRVDGNGNLVRSTYDLSSLRYKKYVRDLTKDIDLEAAWNLRPVTYELRAAMLRGVDDVQRRHGGFIAEEVHDLGLTEFVDYEEGGAPNGLHYSRMVAVAVALAQDERAQRLAAEAAAEERVTDLETRMAALEQTIQTLTEGAR